MRMSDLLFMPRSKWTTGLDEVAVSSRIRLARNLSDRCFPHLMNDQQAQSLLNEGEEAVKELSRKTGQPYSFYRLSDLTAVQRGVLLEKHLISPLLLEQRISTAVAIRHDEAVSIMFNEEDHLRIQCFLPGEQLVESWSLADQVDDCLGEVLSYAFDEKLGYLTTCPTNLGSGLRASVMLHLPALVMTQKAAEVFDNMARLGLVVRGVYGEKTQGLGDLFQLSNQITLGKKEIEIINYLQSVAEQMIEKEKQSRRILQQQSAMELYDSVWRAYGILTNARSISTCEMMEKISLLRLGSCMGIINNIDAPKLNELMLSCQPNFIGQKCQKELSPVQRDWERADLIRKTLKKIKEE
jgi:protein arginine kinase